MIFICENLRQNSFPRCLSLKIILSSSIFEHRIQERFDVRGSLSDPTRNIPLRSCPLRGLRIGRTPGEFVAHIDSCFDNHILAAADGQSAPQKLVVGGHGPKTSRDPRPIRFRVSSSQLDASVKYLQPAYELDGRPFRSSWRLTNRTSTSSAKRQQGSSSEPPSVETRPWKSENLRRYRYPAGRPTYRESILEFSSR